MKPHIAFTFVALLSACGSNNSSDNKFFPLDAGREWRYRVTTSSATGESVREVLIVNAETTAVNGQNARVRSVEGSHFYAIAATPAGVQRLGMRRVVDDDFAPEPEPRFVLKTPYAVGTLWQAQTVPYLLMRRADFPPEVGLSHSAMMTYTIAALDQAVEVPAGKFTGCLHVRGEAAVRLFADPAIGFADVPLTSNEWYCPGVGLTKLERIEEIRSPFLTGGSVRWELVATR